MRVPSDDTGSVPELVAGVPQRLPAGDVPGQGAVTEPVPPDLCGVGGCRNEPSHDGDHWVPSDDTAGVEAALRDDLAEGARVERGLYREIAALREAAQNVLTDLTAGVPPNGRLAEDMAALRNALGSAPSEQEPEAIR